MKNPCLDIVFVIDSWYNVVIYLKESKCMYQFYDLAGKEIDKKEFIQLYNTCYYLTNSYVAEKEIENLLTDGIKSREDVFKIFAWKIGRIDHKRSRQEGKICYTKGCCLEKYEMTTRQGTINIEKICRFIEREYTNLSKKKPVEILDELRKEPDKIEKLGSVYLLTLVYFISKGKAPIYDRFAKMALDACMEKKKLGSYVKPFYLPDKKSKKLYSSYEENYSSKLYEYFGEELKNRNLDRALWVYGHLFRDQK